MALEVKIPSMGESITGGLLASWTVKSGDAVKKGQNLYSYETDKITSEGTAEADGKITILVNAGTEVLVGQVVATIEVGAAGSSPAPAASPAASAPAPAAKPATATPAPAPQPIATKSVDVGDVSPAVRRIAAETGLNPASIPGTGKDGRVTKGDMLAALDAKTPIHTVTPS
ncbi:MAG: dihydrolipoamide succinyltransferase, partial [Verrucomicrobia bacterium]|nr:dihydrolipoamide succinyltransferase [Verrucomicrobiota bacterium]